MEGLKRLKAQGRGVPGGEGGRPLGPLHTGERDTRLGSLFFHFSFSSPVSCPPRLGGGRETVNTGLSGASPDDFQTSPLVPSLDARALAPLQAVRLPLCSTFQKLLRTAGPTAGFLGPAFPSVPWRRAARLQTGSGSGGR